MVEPATDVLSTVAVIVMALGLMGLGVFSVVSVGPGLAPSSSSSYMQNPVPSIFLQVAAPHSMDPKVQLKAQYLFELTSLKTHFG